MNTQDRPKVEAILPLTFMQNALLFHSLSASDDQGFIHVKLDLYGQLDEQKLRSSWLSLVKRHDVFRSSIHWEKIKSPVQVIHKEADHSWQYLDLSTENPESQIARINQLLEEDRKLGFDFNKASISRILILQLSVDHHRMVWSCHHLLLDGWSSANVIRELAEVYNQINGTQPISLSPIPSTKEYRRDLKENDMDVAKAFWTNYLAGFEYPSLISKFESYTHSSQKFTTKKFHLDKESFRQLEDYAKDNKLTLTSVLQSMWSVVLSDIEGSKDVMFGNITSVRSPRLKNADLMCGLFTNMLPVRVQLDKEDTPSALGEKIQSDQGKTKDFDYVSLDDLQNWTDWPGYLPLFDHIFVVENFPWQDIETRDLRFSNFRSGITSSYPLTVVVKVEDGLRVEYIYDESKISENLVEALARNFIAVLKRLPDNYNRQIETIMTDLIPINIEASELSNNEDQLDRALNKELDQPSNPTELALTRIWENLFVREGIGIHENFFEIGGKSLLAVRLFQIIQKELDVNAPPIMILKYPTISKLAEYLQGGKNNLEWKSLVPLRVKGNRNPIFCLHAKGGYVFFYNKFASYLDKDQPIYALQPRGLNGEEPMYESIEEMASHYIDEIKSIQPEGPYNILATCFSNAVGLEMAQQLKSRGEAIGNLFMIDAAPGKSQESTTKSRGTLAVVNYRIKQTVIYNQSKKLYKKLRGTAERSDENIDFSVKHEKHLAELFGQYERRPYNGKIILVRSAEYQNLKKKDFQVEDWLNIVTKENLETMIVNGHHKTLFLEPEVQNLAEAFNLHLAKTENVNSHK